MGDVEEQNENEIENESEVWSKNDHINRSYKNIAKESFFFYENDFQL